MIVDIRKIYFKEISVRNRVYNFALDFLIKAKKLETKTNLTDEKIYKDLTIFFTEYDPGKSIRMLSLYYHKLMGKAEEDEEKNI